MMKYAFGICGVLVIAAGVIGGSTSIGGAIISMLLFLIGSILLSTGAMLSKLDELKETWAYWERNTKKVVTQWPTQEENIIDLEDPV